MFDLFGKKRIRQLEADLERTIKTRDEFNVGYSAARNQVEYLVRTIRDMDQEIWNMSQKTSWDQQRPHFVKLQDGMTARKVAESNRINDIMRPQLIETYKPKPDAQDSAIKALKNWNG